MTAPILPAPAGDPAGLNAAAGQLDQVAASLAGQGDQLSRARGRLTGVWTSDRASPVALAEAETLHRTAAECERCTRGGAAALREYATALADAQQTVRGIQQQAGAVEQDTRVQLARNPDASRQILDNAQVAYCRLQTRHQQVMDSLDQAARRARSTLESLAPASQAGAIGTAATTPAFRLLESPTTVPGRNPLDDLLRGRTPMPTRIPPTLMRTGPYAVLLALLYALYKTIEPVSTAQPWQDEINPKTGQPYASEEEYNKVQEELKAAKQPNRPQGPTNTCPPEELPAGSRLPTEPRDPLADLRQGPVGYRSTDMSRMAFDYRMEQAGRPGDYVKAGQNVAVYEVKVGENDYRYYIAENEPLGLHSEQVLNNKLDCIDPKTVTRIYSERVPCLTAGAECAGTVGRYPNAKVTWSYDGDPNETARDIYEQMKQAQKQLPGR